MTNQSSPRKVASSLSKSESIRFNVSVATGMKRVGGKEEEGETITPPLKCLEQAICLWWKVYSREGVGTWYLKICKGASSPITDILATPLYIMTRKYSLKVPGNSCCYRKRNLRGGLPIIWTTQGCSTQKGPPFSECRKRGENLWVVVQERISIPQIYIKVAHFLAKMQSYEKHKFWLKFWYLKVRCEHCTPRQLLRHGCH